MVLLKLIERGIEKGRPEEVSTHHRSWVSMMSSPCIEFQKVRPALALNSPALSGPTLCGLMDSSCWAISGVVPDWWPSHGLMADFSGRASIVPKTARWAVTRPDTTGGLPQRVEAELRHPVELTVASLGERRRRTASVAHEGAWRRRPAPAAHGGTWRRSSSPRGAPQVVQTGAPQAPVLAACQMRRRPAQRSSGPRGDASGWG
jgi:hypothetical protein